MLNANDGKRFVNGWDSVISRDESLRAIIVVILLSVILGSLVQVFGLIVKKIWSSNPIKYYEGWMV